MNTPGKKGKKYSLLYVHYVVPIHKQQRKWQSDVVHVLIVK